MTQNGINIVTLVGSIRLMREGEVGELDKSIKFIHAFCIENHLAYLCRGTGLIIPPWYVDSKLAKGTLCML